MVSTPFNTAPPTVGYAELPFQGQRTVSVWYPALPKTQGSPSPDPFEWGVFNLSEAPPDQKRAVIVLSHGHSGNPHQLAWLTKELVQNGFMVIGTQHLDFLDNPGPCQPLEKSRRYQ